MTQKQKNSVELTNLIETEYSIAVNDITKKLSKKCGEIYIDEKDIFSFLCTFCESPFEVEAVEHFFNHIYNNHINKCCSENVKDEIVDKFNIYNKEIKSEDYENADNVDNENCTDSFLIKTTRTHDEQKFEDVNETLRIKKRKTFLKIKKPTKKNPLCTSDESRDETKNILNDCSKNIKFEDENETLRIKKRKTFLKIKKPNKKNPLCTSDESKDETKNILNDCSKNIEVNILMEHENKNSNTENINDSLIAEIHDEHNLKRKKLMSSKKTISTIKCKYCTRSFPDSTKREEHERIHTGERPLQCQTCGKCFRTRAICMNHERSHSNIRQYKCEICNLSFKNKADLYMHTQRHGERKISCNYCDKLFYKNSEMKRHERSHTGEKPYKCNFCEKCFQTSTGLKAHIRGHSGIRPYNCMFCEKCFTTKAVLDNHIVMHTGARPFKCEICSATFPRKKALKSHEKIHSDVCDYVCKICGKAFKLYQGLYSHMNKHGLSLAKS